MNKLTGRQTGKMLVPESAEAGHRKAGKRQEITSKPRGSAHLLSWTQIRAGWWHHRQPCDDIVENIDDAVTSSAAPGASAHKSAPLLSSKGTANICLGMFYNPIRKTDVPRSQRQPRAGWQRHCFKHTHTHTHSPSTCSVFTSGNIFIPGFHHLLYISICFHIPCRINRFQSHQVNISGFLVKPFHHFQSCVLGNETSSAVNTTHKHNANRSFPSWLVSAKISRL